MSLWKIDDGTLHLDLHSGQSRTWESRARFVAMLAGSQSGKTSFEPWWLWREIQRAGSGDYLAVTASYDMFKLKFLPTLRECFEHILRIGRYWAADRIIELANPATGRFLAQSKDDPMWGRIILRSAESAGGLESATAQAAVLDEAGLYPDAEIWEAVLRRLSLSLGRVLLGTTVYTLNWLKTRIFDRWKKGDPDFEVVNFDSIANPAFPRAEYERARRDMPAWKFNMRYRGLMDRPAGMIYDVFDADAMTCRRFPIPRTWPRYWGGDFGGVHTAFMFYAEDPQSGRLYAYREYLAGGLTAQGHVDALLRRDEPAGRQEPMPRLVVAGSLSEDQWRDEFVAAGLPIEAPDIADVEVGIQRVYGVHARNELLVFDDLTGYLEQKASYSRVLDDAGEPTEAIANKQVYHFLDAERYVLGKIRPGQPPEQVAEEVGSFYA